VGRQGGVVLLELRLLLGPSQLASHDSYRLQKNAEQVVRK
jgi:hypothetical protein